jgi:hypothetical protein
MRTRCSNDGVLRSPFPVAHHDRDALLEICYRFLWFNVVHVLILSKLLGIASKFLNYFPVVVSASVRVRATLQWRLRD